MEKIVVANVLYTTTDETFYISKSQLDGAENYIKDTLDETIASLETAGWNRCGKVSRWDGVHVDMMTNGKLDYIALWVA